MLLHLVLHTMMKFYHHIISKFRHFSVFFLPSTLVYFWSWINLSASEKYLDVFNSYAGIISGETLENHFLGQLIYDLGTVYKLKLGL
jgi:hypothetical protein